jgi:hypothetical protein
MNTSNLLLLMETIIITQSQTRRAEGVKSKILITTIILWRNLLKEKGKKRITQVVTLS